MQQPRNKRDEGGFTLIELLVIIIILGILATIVVLATLNVTHSSAVSGCKADFKTIETAQEAYRGQVGTSATSFNDLLVQRVGQNGSLVGPWIKEAPNSPYYTIGLDTTPGPTFGDVTVATTGHGAADGSANCSFA
jgi:prepilin-type N-terminal cleavage/methylation domain-containing protein